MLTWLMNVAGHNPNLALTGCNDSRAIGPNQPRFFSMHERCDTHHVHHRNSFRDANYEFNSGINRFQNRIGSRRSRDENHRCVATSFLSRFPNRVEYRYFLLEHLAALPRGNACDHVRAVVHALSRVKRARAARNSLHDQPRPLINENRHGRNDE